VKGRLRVFEDKTLNEAFGLRQRSRFVRKRTAYNGFIIQTLFLNFQNI